MTETPYRKRRPGRQPIPEAERRARMLSLRLTDAEWALVERAAGDRPLRVWARDRLLYWAHEHAELERYADVDE